MTCAPPASPAGGRLYGARRSAYPPQLLPARNATASLPAPATRDIDLRSTCLPVQNQLSSGKCVGEAFKAGLYLALKGESRPASSRGIYLGGRAREVAMARGAPIPDVGSTVSDCIDGMVETGVFPEDAAENDMAQATTLESWAEAAAKRLVPPEAFAPIDDGDTDTIDRFLAAGFGVEFCMSVDDSYEQLSGPQVWTGPTGSSRGNHSQLIVGKLVSIVTPAYIVQNSWGPGFGAAGFALIACSFVAGQAFDMAAVCGAVQL